MTNKTAIKNALADWMEDQAGDAKVFYRVDMEAAYKAGAKWALEKFKVCGTDSCPRCQTGRISVFMLNRACVTCDPEAYE